jgi:hypothetical protein
VVSDESFWPASLGVLRLRSAYGRSRSAASPFHQAVTYRGGGAPTEDEANRLIEPEDISEWEVGLDGATLGGRLGIGFSYYHQTTRNALVSVEDSAGTAPFRSELQNLGRTRNRGIELELDVALVNTARWGVDVGLDVTTNHSKLLDIGGVQPFRDLNARLVVGQPVPVSYGFKVADPDAVTGPWTRDRYALGSDGLVGPVPLGPQLPTHFLSPSLTLRMPFGVTLSARGEYRGGNILYVNPVAVARGVVSPLCLPYYVDPAARSLEVKADVPDLWKERCSQTGGRDYWYDADYFKLRNVTALIPVGSVFPGSVDDATFSVTLANAYRWHREVPWWDLEILSYEGANGDGLGSSERVPAPAVVTFGMRVRF